MMAPSGERLRPEGRYGVLAVQKMCDPYLSASEVSFSPEALSLSLPFTIIPTGLPPPLRLLVRVHHVKPGLSQRTVCELQRGHLFHNSAARLVCTKPALSHVTPLLRQLHWLPVARRITYKLCVLMFDVFHGTSPEYLTDLCSRCSDQRLRSTRGNFV